MYQVKSFLVLGAGRVAFPCIEYAARKQYQVTVVSGIESELKQIQLKLPNVKTELLDIGFSTEDLNKLVANHDVVASLLPSHFHAAVAECCIQQKKPMITASYIDDDLRKLDQRARDAGIVIIGECGLDPGLDHMISVCEINAIKEAGGTIHSFSSVCGGLPAPEFKDEVLNYKFSWHPKGALLCNLRPATFSQDNQVINIAGDHILDHTRNASDNILHESVEFETIPNGNALPYQELYDIASAKSVFRGTLRYKGFSRVMKSLIHLGLLSSDDFPALAASAPSMTWREVISLLLKLPSSSSLDDITEQWSKICKDDMVPMETIFKLLTENESAPKALSLIDSLSSYLTEKLSFAPGEIDLVVMRNEIEYLQANGEKKRVTIDLVKKGEANGSSAMALTVGLTVAVAASLLLEGRIKKTGVIIPVYEEIYKPILDKVAMEGIEIKTSEVAI